MNEKPLQAFWLFVKESQSIWKWVFLGASQSWVIGFLVGIGPPWPAQTSIALLTVIVEIVVYMFTFEFYPPKKAVGFLQNRFFQGILVFVGFCLIYLLLTTFFVVRYDDEPKSTEARGFVMRQAAKDHWKEKENSHLSENGLIAEFGGDVYQVYEKWTVDAMRFVLLLFWFGVFGSLTAVFAIFVSLQVKKIKPKADMDEQKGQNAASSDMNYTARQVASKLVGRGYIARQNADNKSFFVNLGGPDVELDKDDFKGLVLFHPSKSVMLGVPPGRVREFRQQVMEQSPQGGWQRRKGVPGPSGDDRVEVDLVVPTTGEPRMSCQGIRIEGYAEKLAFDGGKCDWSSVESFLDNFNNYCLKG